MTINEKLKVFQGTLDISERRFTMNCGLSEGALRGSRSVGTESLIKIKVADVSLVNSTIWIDAIDSKSRTGKHITIPDRMLGQLADHLKNAKMSDYLFSTNDFLPGKKRLRPDRITKTWNYMRVELELERDIQWYSLKDSGITDLLAAGVPLIAVRDQARHESSQQTDAYTPRKILKANQNIKTANI